MPLYNASALIKKLRIAHGFTQEKLAEGICSRATISKIERGERKPDWFILLNVLQKLGVKPDDFHSNISELISDNEAYIITKRDECQRHFEANDFDSLKNILDELAQDERFTKSYAEKGGRGYQIYLRYKALLHIRGQYEDTPACINYAMECIRLSRPDFEIERISEYFLSPEELQLLSIIAVAYEDMTIEILRQIKSNYEEHYTANAQGDRRYRELLLNIVSALINAGHYEECLEVAEEGLSYALMHSEMRTCLIYFRHTAWCLMKLGRTKEGKEQYKKFLMLAYVMDSYSIVSVEEAQRSFEEAFGDKVSISLSPDIFAGENSTFVKGAKSGRPPNNLPNNFAESVQYWEQGKISFGEALERTKLKQATFYRRLKEYRKAKADNTHYQNC